jgi:hypothetical protein
MQAETFRATGAARLVRASWSDEEARAVALVRSQAPLRRALARTAGRLVAVRGWERLGFARPADYARERLGFAARQLQELACVDARFEALPLIEAAFVSGALSWTKARLLCRIATAENEARWIAFARTTTARELSHQVRAADETDEDGADAGPRETVQIRCTAAVQAQWWRGRQLAQRVAGDALPPWACMEAVVAEVLSAIPLDAASGDPEPAVLDGEERDPVGAANGCAAQGPVEEVPTPAELPALLCSFVDGLEAADAFELDARLRRAVALEQRLWADASPLLAAVARHRLYLASGHRSLDAWARERLGISPRKLRALLRLERAGAVCPALLAAYRDGRLSWVQAHTLVAVLLLDGSQPWRSAWIRFAEQVSVRRLEEEVERALALRELEPPRAERQTRAHAVPPEASPETSGFSFTAPREVALLVRAAICTVRRHIERRTGRLPSAGEAVAAMIEHAFDAWGANDPQIRREHRVFARDGWRCTVPGCSSFRNLQDHHVVFRSAGGSDRLENRTTLCAWHHQRGVHAGRVRCSGRAPDQLRFDLGLRAGRAPLVSYGSGEILMT